MLYRHLTRNSDRDTCTITNEITGERMITTVHGSEFVLPNVFVRNTRNIEDKWIHDVAIHKDHIRIAS